MASPSLITVTFHRQYLCCSLGNNRASSSERDTAHKLELRLTLSTSGLVSAKTSFQNSHVSKLPPLEAVTPWRGVAGFGLGGSAHYKPVNLLRELRPWVCRHKPTFTAAVRVLKTPDLYRLTLSILCFLIFSISSLVPAHSSTCKGKERLFS